jgi:hypothetical protein
MDDVRSIQIKTITIRQDSFVKARVRMQEDEAFC